MYFQPSPMHSELYFYSFTAGAKSLYMHIFILTVTLLEVGTPAVHTFSILHDNKGM